MIKQLLTFNYENRWLLALMATLVIVLLLTLLEYIRRGIRTQHLGDLNESILYSVSPNRYSLFSFCLILLFFLGCETSDSYEVQIGEQTWMTKNLSVGKFQNGDEIPQALSFEEWEKFGEAMQPAWAYPGFDASNEADYGRLYNWHAVNDKRGLAPNGWHIPTDKEWSQLVEFLGGPDAAGVKMKKDSEWDDEIGSNESKFSGIPAGTDRGFLGRIGQWWSSSGSPSYEAWSRRMENRYYDISRSLISTSAGLSVRCIKGSGLPFAPSSDEVVIGLQTWMTRNLNVDRFRNGDLIPEAKSEAEWEEALRMKQPVWCYYQNNPLLGQTYGRLYNRFAVNDPRGLAPSGWHIPSEDEMSELVGSLGGKSRAAEKLKAINGWRLEANGDDYTNKVGNNESGFWGLPAGIRGLAGNFYGLGEKGNWMTSTTADGDFVNLSLEIYCCGSDAVLSAVSGDGISVRCIKN